MGLQNGHAFSMMTRMMMSMMTRIMSIEVLSHRESMGSIWEISKINDQTKQVIINNRHIISYYSICNMLPKCN